MEDLRQEGDPGSGGRNSARVTSQRRPSPGDTVAEAGGGLTHFAGGGVQGTSSDLLRPAPWHSAGEADFGPQPSEL